MYKRKLKWQLVPGHRNLRGRAGHTATLVGKHIYILGGRNGNEFFNDLWVFDTEIEQWDLLQAKVPFSPRAYHSCTLVNENELWVIGGSDPKMMHSDVHVFNTGSLKWSCPILSNSSMTPRGTHAAVLHPKHKRSILIYGGYGGSKPSWLSDLLIFHTDTLEWQDLMPEGAKPKGRGYHTFTAFGSYVALFGGKADGGIINEEKLSIYDAVTNRWNMIAVRGQPPCPRSNHAAVLMVDGLIVIHGGRHGSLRLSDTYVLQVPLVPCNVSDLELSWHMIEQSEHLTVLKKTPRKRSLDYDTLSGRSAHSLVAKAEELYMFGGYGGEGLTFADMFVLHKFPKIPELEVRSQPLAKKSVIEIADIIEENDNKEVEEREDDGWKSTKILKLHAKQKIDFPKSAATKLQSKQEVLGCRENLSTPESRSTEPIRKNSWPQARTVLSVEDGSMAMFLQEKELYQKEVKSLQQSMEALKETIKEKTLVDPNFHQRTLQLEHDVQRLQKEKLELHSTVGDLEKELTHQNKKYRKLEQENKTLKSHMQDLKYSLDDKENARQAELVKVDDYEKQLHTVSKSLEGSNALVSEVSLERDKYKSCVQALETELEKQMEALKQVSSRFEAEKTFLLKEIADRQMTVDKLLTDLGASKECMKSLEDALSRQVRQIEQDSHKITSLQKERETLTCVNAVLISENKQLIEAKEGAESSCLLLRSELQSVRMMADEGGIQILQLKEAVEQTKEHSSILHESLKKNEEKLMKQMEEYDKIRGLMRETEEFELAQVRTLQAHAEKLRCARQSCPYQ